MSFRWRPVVRTGDKMLAVSTCLYCAHVHGLSRLIRASLIVTSQCRLALPRNLKTKLEEREKRSLFPYATVAHRNQDVK